MREIKFRAWHKATAQMFWFDVMWGSAGSGGGWVGMLPFGVERKWVGMRSNVELVDPNECELMQFTGLHDKNGKEIYEGDNLRVIETHSNEIVYESATVLYSERYAEFRLVAANPLSYYVSSYHAFEIIGNIHENMEKHV